MKTIVLSTVSLFFISAGLVAAAPPATDANPLVNAYGEPAGFGNLPAFTMTSLAPSKMGRAYPGAGGMFVVPGWVDPRSFESMGSRQARLAADAPGIVTIGALEVLDSGPTGPMSSEAQAAARDQVTAQVLERIRVTDKVMASLTRQSESQDANSQGAFKAAAAQVADRRLALREDLKTARAADSDHWTAARTSVAVSFNAYVQTLHQAEASTSAIATPAAT